MPLNNLLCGLIEVAVNKLQHLDKTTPQQRKALDGTIIGVTLKDLNQSLYFIINKQKIDVVDSYDGQANSHIKLNLSALKKLQNNDQLTHLIKTEQLEVEGDIKQVQQFAQLLTELNIDWEELLSTQVGDILAHKACYYGRVLQKKLSTKLTELEKHTAQFITEEIKVTPSALELTYFCDQVEELNKQCAAIENRINNISNR